MGRKGRPLQGRKRSEGGQGERTDLNNSALSLPELVIDGNEPYYDKDHGKNTE